MFVSNSRKHMCDRVHFLPRHNMYIYIYVYCRMTTLSPTANVSVNSFNGILELQHHVRHTLSLHACMEYILNPIPMPHLHLKRPMRIRRLQRIKSRTVAELFLVCLPMQRGFDAYTILDSIGISLKIELSKSYFVDRSYTRVHRAVL